MCAVAQAEAESKDSTSLDSARLVLAHALLLILGKASHKFFEVVDSVNCLDSESSELVSKFCFYESLESMELDSEFTLHSALGLPSWRGVDCVGLLLQTTKQSFFRKLVIAVVLVEFLAGAGVGVTS